MEEYTVSMVQRLTQGVVQSSLEDLLREGARKMLQAALELEVDEYIERSHGLSETPGRQAAVRNGSHRRRELVSGIGKLTLRQPRVHDRREGQHFTSAILPPYLRRTPSIEALIPALYLKGLSTSCFPEALQAILGEDAGGLSAANVVRLKKVWEGEFTAWQKRDLTGKRYVYVWADGIYFNVRLEPERPCLLVLIGATAEGKKELIALHDGQRESKLSWQAVLQDLKARGLTVDPFLATGDGSLGFWAALREEGPSTLEQRCWVHKTAHILDKLPKTLQPDAKGLLQQLYLSATKNAALKAYDQFISRYEAKYPAACECLTKDQEVLFTFYDFPAEHWRHIRTTNPIESTFSTVRHRTRQTKGCGSRIATLTMAFKLTREAEKRWQRLHGYRLLDQVITGAVFVDGELKNAA